MNAKHKSNGNAWAKARARVLATESVCGICGHPVNKTLPALDPGAPQVDHIIAISNGGAPTARSNLRLSHRACNRARSNNDAPWLDRPNLQSW